jgi:hypothetical protein
MPKGSAKTPSLIGSLTYTGNLRKLIFIRFICTLATKPAKKLSPANDKNFCPFFYSATTSLGKSINGI